MLLHTSVLSSSGLFPGTRLRGCTFAGPAEAGGWGMGFSYLMGKKAWEGGKWVVVYGIVYYRDIRREDGVAQTALVLRYRRYGIGTLVQ